MQFNRTPLLLAVEEGHAAIMEVLLQRGTAIDKISIWVRSHVPFNTLLYICAKLFLDVSCERNYHQRIHSCLVI